MLSQISLTIDLSLTQFYSNIQAQQKNSQQPFKQKSTNKIKERQTQNQQIHNHIILTPSLVHENLTPFFYDKILQQGNLYVYDISNTNNQLSHQTNSQINKQQTQITLNAFKNKVKHIYTIIQQLCQKYLETDSFMLIIQSFNLKDIQNLLQKKLSNVDQQQDYLIYTQEGIQLDKIEAWKFKHSPQGCYIDYQNRQKLFDNFLIITDFLSKVTKSKMFNSSTLITLNDILVTRSDKNVQIQSQFKMKIKVQWLFDMINSTEKAGPVKQYQILENVRKILRLLLGIPEQKSKLNQLELFHFDKIQNIITFDDFIKLKYSDFYTNPSANKKAKNINNQQKSLEQRIKQKREESIHLRQIISKLQEQTKKQTNSQSTKADEAKNSKIIQMNQKQNPKFWNQISQYILKNITQNQRSSLILKEKNNKKQLKLAPSAKKSQKQKPSVISTNSKTPTVKKANQKQANKNQQPITKDKITKKEEVKSQQIKVDNKKWQVSNIQQEQAQNELDLQFKYLCSGSQINLRPQKLYSLIESKEAILYVMKVKNQDQKSFNYIAFFTNIQISKDFSPFFGEYFTDAAKKSFIYSAKTQRFYQVLDKNHAFGFGPQVFMTIGKLDLIIPSLSNQIVQGKQMVRCISYFPISYSQNGSSLNQFQRIQQEQGQMNTYKSNNSLNQTKKTNSLGLQRQFFLQQIDIYEIKYLVKNLK